MKSTTKRGFTQAPWTLKFVRSPIFIRNGGSTWMEFGGALQKKWEMKLENKCGIEMQLEQQQRNAPRCSKKWGMHLLARRSEKNNFLLEEVRNETSSRNVASSSKYYVWSGFELAERSGLQIKGRNFNMRESF